MGDEGFDLWSARVGDMYPSAEILAEIGRVVIAAARVDQELALVLVALKLSVSFEELTKKNSSSLDKLLKERIAEYFDSKTQETTNQIRAIARESLEARHAVVHSVWTPDERKSLFAVDDLQAVKSQEELDALVGSRVASVSWRTRHPKAEKSGPESHEELVRIRTSLEESKSWLTMMRFRLASSLFAGTPPGAREVMNPDSL